MDAASSVSRQKGHHRGGRTELGSVESLSGRVRVLVQSVDGRLQSIRKSIVVDFAAALLTFFPLMMAVAELAESVMKESTNVESSGIIVAMR